MAGELPHLKIDAFYALNDYVYPRTGSGSGLPLIDRDRAIHGNRVISQLNTIRDQFEIAREEPLPDNIVRDDALYVEFISEWNFALAFESFNQETTNPKFQLVHIKREAAIIQGEEKERYKVVVTMREGGVSAFLKKAGEYMTETTKDRRGNDTGLPAHRALIANIESIALASLRSFWSDEPEFPFPAEEAVVWWEVWFRRTGDDQPRLNRVAVNLEAVGAQIGQQTLQFPENIVRLVRASARQLSRSLVLLDNLAELRRPQQLNDFIPSGNTDFEDKKAWMDDLLARTSARFDERSVIICLLDSGVNNRHPLIRNFLPDSRLYTYKEGWGTHDSWNDGGHGTGMGGLSLYGDLTAALSTRNRIEIFHGLESFKIAHPEDANDPRLYGDITKLACSTPVVDLPGHRRVYCLAITDKALAFRGRPSAWSAAVDQIAFGEGPGGSQLFVVSAGNVNYVMPQRTVAEYPNLNHLESIHDPGQSYNALTVGSYTRMDRIDQKKWPGLTPLASASTLSPSSSTSLVWEDQWPVKPDIVMEGGNLAVEGGLITDKVTSLKPLSLDSEFGNFIFAPFGDTSGAAALAAKLAAELHTAYPAYWPETIKGLIVHSADWTRGMLAGIDLRNASVDQKRTLLRTFGYGVPVPAKAFYSAKNTLTLIAETSIQPYRMEGSSVKTKEYHLYKLPWPREVLLEQLTAEDVRLKVTLCYFIEPNPGSRRYAHDFSYHSHALDFKMIGPTESLERFKRRVSAADEQDGVDYAGTAEPWILKERMRSRGSVKKDLVISSGADLATREYIAVYPKPGWYRTRKRLGKADSVVCYSLIISLETKNLDVDIYAPVEQLIAAVIEV